MKIIDNEKVKILKSDDYNYIYNKDSGKFARWGKTPEDDPEFALPEIADVEISTICDGVNGVVCDFCYKDNTKDGKNMSLETFKKVFAKLPPSICQVAFGIGSISGNPELFDIMEYTREKGVVPNITINGDGLTDEYTEKLIQLCGAVSISHYDDETTFNAVKKLTDAGMKQVNLHSFLSEETYGKIKELFKKTKTDERLSKLSAVVMLSLKKKGRGVKYTRIPQDKFEDLVDFAMKQNIKIGFDSCTCPRWLDYMKDDLNYDWFKTLSEPCESSCFSIFIDVNGKAYPCSFTDGVDGWKEGIDVVACKDFIKDVWHNKKMDAFRDKLINNKDENGCRVCPIYNV